MRLVLLLSAKKFYGHQPSVKCGDDDDDSDDDDDDLLQCIQMGQLYICHNN